MKSMTGVPDAEIDKITHRNAMRHFQYDPFKHIPGSRPPSGTARTGRRLGHQRQVGQAPAPGASVKLRDKVVVVTGSGGGIGAAIARRFTAEGARVVVTDIDSVAVQRSFSRNRDGRRRR